MEDTKETQIVSGAAVDLGSVYVAARAELSVMFDANSGGDSRAIFNERVHCKVFTDFAGHPARQRKHTRF